MKRIFYFLSLLFFSCGTSWADFDQWAKSVSEGAPQLMLERLKSDSTVAGFTKTLKGKVKFTGPFKVPVDMNRLNIENGVIQVGSESLKVGSGKGGKSVAQTFTFNSSAKDRLYIKVDYRSVVGAILDGEWLVASRHGFLTSAKTNSMGIPLKPGQHHLTLLPVEGKDIGRSNWTAALSSDLPEKFKSLIQSQFSFPLGSKRSAFWSFLNSLAKEGEYTAPWIAEGILMDIQSDRDFKKDVEGLSNSIHQLLRNMNTGAKGVLLSHCLGQVSDQTIGYAMLGKKLDASFTSDAYAALAYLDLHDEADRIFRKSYDRIESWSKNKKGIGQLLRDIADKYYYLGVFDRSFRYYEKSKEFDVITNKWRKGEFETKSSVNESLSMLDYNIEMDQVLREGLSLLDQEDPTAENLKRVLDILTRQHSEMALGQNGLVNVSASVHLKLKEKTDFLDRFKSYLKRRLDREVPRALESSNIKRLSELERALGDFYDFTETRKYLMKNAMDRGLWSKALRYGRSLAREQKLDAETAASVLILEDISEVPNEHQTQIPSNLKNSKVSFRGEEMTLAQLSKKLGGSTSQSTGSIGEYLYTLDLPAIRQKDVQSLEGSNGRGIGQTFHLRQPTQVATSGDQWIFSGRDFVSAFDTEKGQASWKINLTHGAPEAGFPFFPKKFKVGALAGKIMTLYHGISSKPELLTLDEDGAHLWSSAMHKSFEEWMPVSNPVSFLGGAYVMLQDRKSISSPMLAFARVDEGAGELSELQKLHKTRDAFRRGPNLETDAIQQNGSLLQYEDSLFGVTGSGGVFRYDGDREQMRWLISLEGRNLSKYFDKEVRSSAPGSVQRVGQVCVAYMHDLVSWVGLNVHTGEVMWRNSNFSTPMIHSRGSDRVVILSQHRYEYGMEPELIRLDPATGRTLWRKPVQGLEITGEGLVYQDRLYLPTKRGCAVLDIQSGQSVDFKTTSFQPDQVQRCNGLWLMIAGPKVHVFKGSGTFSGQLPLANKQQSQQKQKTKEEVLTPTYLDQLWIEKTLPAPFPGSIYDVGKFFSIQALDRPGHHLLRSGDSLVVLKEGMREKGIYEPPQILWKDRMQSPIVSGAKITQWTPRAMSVFDVLERKQIFEKRFALDRQSIGMNTNQLTGADAAGNEVAWCLRNGSAVVYSLTHQKEVGQYHYNLSSTRNFKFRYADGVLAFSEAKQTVLVDIRNQSKVIWKGPGNLGQRFLVKGSWIGIGSGGSTHLVHRESGKAFRVSGGRGHWAEIRGKVYCEPNMVIDASGGSSQKKSHVLVGQRRRGALVLDGSKATWHGAEKDIALKPKDNLSSIMGVNGNYPWIRPYVWISPQTRLFVMRSDFYYTFDLKDGEQLHRNPINFETRNNIPIVAPLDKGVLVTINSSMQIYGDVPEKGLEVPLKIWNIPSSKGKWPVDLLPQPQVLSQKSWQSNFVEKSEQPSGVVIGLDNEYIYVHALIDDRHSPMVQSTLFLSAHWFKDPNYTNYWNLSMQYGSNPNRSPSFSPDTIQGAQSWRERDGSGRLHLFSIVPITSLDQSMRANTPTFRLTIEQRKKGEYQGSYLVGAGHSSDVQTTPRSTTHQVSMSPPHIYDRKTKLYSRPFYPQGSKFSSWVMERRQKVGVQQNIKHLEDLIISLKGDSSVIHVLSAYLLEKIEAIRQEDPTRLEVDDAFQKRLAEVQKECMEWAKAQSINDSFIQWGLDLYFQEVFPECSEVPVVATSGGMDFGSSKSEFNLSYAHQIVSRQDRPYLVLFPAGLFNETGKKSLNRIWLSFFKNQRVGLGATKHLIQGQVKTLVSRNQGKTYLTSYRNQRFEVRRAPRQWSFNPKDAPSAINIELKMKKKDLLFALENLNPGDSFAMTLLGRYWSALPKQEKNESSLQEGVTRVLVALRGDYRLSTQAIDFYMREIERSLGMKRKDSLKALAKLLKKAKINIDFSRSMALKYNDYLKNHSIWQSLGPFPYKNDQPFRLVPEPFLEGSGSQSFQVDGQGEEFNFQNMKGAIASSMKSKGISYHRLKINSQKKRKAYFIFNRRNQRTKVKAWLNGEEFANFQFARYRNDHFPYSMRLNSGENELILEVQFEGNWDLYVAIGDRMGFPIRGVEVTQP